MTNKALEDNYTTNNIEDDPYQMFFELNKDKVKHTRTVYSLWDVLSDIGGLFEILQYTA